MKKRNCNECGNEYEYKLETSKFCSGTCRARHAEKKLNGPEAESFLTPLGISRAFSNPTPGVISPQADYMLKHAQKEIDRYEAKYNKEVAKTEKLTDQVKDLEKQLADLKTEQRIADASEPEKPGLGSVVLEKFSSPEYAQFIGPLIQQGGQALIDFIKNPNRQIAGPATTGQDNGFQNWLNSLSESTRNQVNEFLKLLSTQDEITVARTIVQMQSMLGGQMFAHRAS